MRILMISENDISSTQSLGVTKKLKGQFKAFQNLGHEVFHFCLRNGQGVLIGDNIQEVVVQKKAFSYFTVSALFLQAANICEKYSIDICYIRFPLGDWSFMYMIKDLHKKCKVILEIPTFPYDFQASKNKNIVARVNYLQDKINRKYFYKYIDLIVTYGNESSVFGVESVNIANGIDIGSISFVGDKIKYGKNIHLIGVGRLHKVHGYDRIIRGMRDYYTRSPSIKIYFHIVGEGEIGNELKDYVKKYHLENYVLFHGIQTGSDLERLYLQSNIAIGVLGGYREGSVSTSALKNREYCALGIPIISASIDTGIDSNSVFYKIIENDDSAISMNTIIDYYNMIRTNPSIHREMRSYAEKYLSWETQLETVFKKIGNEEMI